MREFQDDIWQLSRLYVRTHKVGFPPEVAICITTNGYVKNNGRCVMGKGIAATALQCSPNIDLSLGTLINEKGNVVHLLPEKINECNLISFPVKPIYERRDQENPTQVVKFHRNKFAHGAYVPGWACTARVNIIEKSCQELVMLAEQHPEWTDILIPRMGCGAGELDWKDIKPLVEGYFSDKKYIVCSL